jgi:hypothetical protein
MKKAAALWGQRGGFSCCASTQWDSVECGIDLKNSRANINMNGQIVEAQISASNAA